MCTHTCVNHILIRVRDTMSAGKIFHITFKFETMLLFRDHGIKLQGRRVKRVINSVVPGCQISAHPIFWISRGNCTVMGGRVEGVTPSFRLGNKFPPHLVPAFPGLAKGFWVTKLSRMTLIVVNFRPDTEQHKKKKGRRVGHYTHS